MWAARCALLFVILCLSSTTGTRVVQPLLCVRLVQRGPREIGRLQEAFRSFLAIAFAAPFFCLPRASVSACLSVTAQADLFLCSQKALPADNALPVHGCASCVRAARVP
jgi:hypothetical protein